MSLQTNQFAQAKEKHQNRKVFLYGVGIVAPGAANLTEFFSLIHAGKSALSPKKSLCNAFLEGKPKFDFSVYKSWLEERHGPKRYPLLKEKSGELIQYGVGSLIQALSSQPGLEDAIKSLDPAISIQYATGLGDLPVIQNSARELDKSLFTWNAFWATPERNHALAHHLQSKDPIENLPPSPQNFPIDSQERYEALKNWNAYWAPQSHLMHEYLAKLSKIEIEGIKGRDIEAEKLTLIRHKIRSRKELVEQYGCPTPPWESVSPNLLWNIPNLAASQVSMLLNLKGESLGVSGACASFGVLINQAYKDIKAGHIDLAIIGSVDTSPSDELISAFYSGRLAAIGEKNVLPFCDLRGTHISGGACTWILADEETMKRFSIKHLGIEILGAGVSSDGEHIITPSKEGPKLAIQRAFSQAHIEKKDIHLWDMHATGTPGDLNEFLLIEDFVPPSAYISARKGIFGHGMAVSGGWELTAQLLCLTPSKNKGVILAPSGIEPSRVNPQIASLNRKLLLNKPVEIPFPKEGLICGKLGMGVGGISSCVVTRVSNSDDFYKTE